MTQTKTCHFWSDQSLKIVAYLHTGKDSEKIGTTKFAVCRTKVLQPSTNGVMQTLDLVVCFVIDFLVQLKPSHSEVQSHRVQAPSPPLLPPAGELLAVVDEDDARFMPRVPSSAPSVTRVFDVAGFLLGTWMYFGLLREAFV